MTATPMPPSKKSPLARVKEAAKGRDLERRAAPPELVSAIMAARTANPPYTLQEIADALGVSRQAVHQLLTRHRELH